MEAAARVTKKRGQEDDRISSLPDATLCHILSFLPTKYSVRTRILSTRWKYLFAYVPVLDFDSYNCSETNISPRKFIDFVNRVLLMYEFPQIARFRLVSLANKLNDLVTWILYAIRHNVRELDISVTLKKAVTIPRELFSSEMLSVLKLRGDFCLKLLSSSALLPSLKILELGFLSFDLPPHRIISICPALEDLFLYCCGFENEKVVNITHTSLKKLRIEGCYGSKLILNVSNLVCFEYLRSDINGFRGENALTSLVEAVIDPGLIMDSAAFLQLLNVVSHAQRLCLSTIPTLAFYRSVEALPTFHKLTRLEVGEVSSTVCELLPHLLNKCSILEVLVFTRWFCREELDDVDMKCYENVPSCVLRHLKEIEFRAFTLREFEWKLVEYFLKNAQVLQDMKIQPCLSWKKQYKLRKKLSTFSRYSKDCQIVIEFDDGSDDETEDSEDETE